MDDELFLGVDGGGTSCRARLADRSGRVLGEGVGGPANARLGMDLVYGSILAAARGALTQAGLPEAVLARTRAGFGLAGAAQALERNLVLSHPHPFASLALETDAYAACLGAHGGADGAILILGTGTCGFALIGGRRLNVGGWGFHVSDDGSGAQMGREAIRRALWALEGMLPEGALSDAVLAPFERSPERIVAFADRAQPADYGKLAPLVLEHAARGDAMALGLLADTIGHVTRIAERLLDSGAPSICLMGGLAAPLTPHLPATIRARLAAPQGDAMDGALLMARR